LLAEEFRSHDLGNKKSIRNGHLELIEMRQDGEYAPNDETTHEDARKAWNAQKEIDKLEEQAEEILCSDEETEFDLEQCIRDQLDRLDSAIQHYGKTVDASYNAEDTEITTHRTFEDMIYNLLDNSVQHGATKISLELDDYSEGLEMRVDDGGNGDFDEILPGTLDREDYQGTGTYLIDRVLDRTGTDVEDTEQGYSLKMPRP